MEEESPVKAPENRVEGSVLAVDSENCVVERLEIQTIGVSHSESDAGR